MTMRAVQYDRYGGPEVLEVRTVPVPSPKRGEVLVRVHASGLNPKDAMVRSGGLQPLSGRTFPRGTGFDFAGEVAEPGEGVTDLARGQRVWGFLDGFMGGAAAEYVAAPREWLAPMPDRLDWVEGGAMPLVGSTALQALRDVARIGPGERLLIRGASGGVGSAAIQIGKAFGVHVTAIASGAGVEHCRALGADEVVDYRQTDPTSLREKFDVFLDCVGGSPIRAWWRLLARGGRWVAVPPSVPVYALAPVSRVVTPFLGWRRFGFVVVKPRRADLEEIGRLVERALLRMPVTATYRLEEIRAAHAVVGERHGMGKRVVVVSA
ncbi:MAG TPA: NAD(P)-dependent alcohol dehydrogenase, partial [Gemmatimonadales bacterium]|nr:NAD(P)-dependent alcohol dehydrogenase [Gemmatimonadales bacterium]